MNSNPIGTASYIVYNKSGVYRAECCDTGSIYYSGTDATTVFNSIINECNANGGGRIFIKNGIYTLLKRTQLTGPFVGIYGAIIMKSYVDLCGESKNGVILKLGDNIQANIICDQQQTIYSIENLTLDGNRNNQTDGGRDGNQCCLYTPSNYSIVRNIICRNAIREGFYADGSDHQTFENICTKNNGRAGFAFSSPIRSTASNIYAYQNNQIGGTAGIIFDNLTACSADNCWSMANILGGGFYFTGGNGLYTSQNTLTFNHLYSYGNSYYGFEIGGVAPHEMQSIKFGSIFSENDGWNGLYTIGARNCTFDYVYVKNCGQKIKSEALKFYYVTNCQIGYLYVLDNQNIRTTQYAITITDLTKCSGNLILGGDLSQGGFIKGTIPSYNTAANIRLLNVIGYVTKNAGYSIGTGAQQSVSHGCNFTPTASQVFLSERATGGAIPYQSAIPDGTNIYVTASSGKDYNWRVEQ